MDRLAHLPVIDAWLGIDLGTQSVRAVVLGEDGERLAAASLPLTSSRVDDRHEQDPAEWLRATFSVVRQATGALPVDVRIAALSVSGTSGTIVPMDDRGRPIGPGVMYDDRRGTRFLPQVQDAGEAVWSRLGYRMQATWGLPKLLDLIPAAAPGTVFGHQPDVITSALGGGLLPSDLSSALKTGADLDAIDWPEAVLDRLGLPTTAVNRVVASGTVIGRVSSTAADATGLPVGCAIVAGCTDGCAAQIAAGAILPGTWNAVLGTTLVIKGAARERLADPTGAVYAHRAPFDSGWYPGGASSTGAGAVTALLPGRDLDEVTARARTLPDIPVAYPLVGRGERFPFVASDAEGFWPIDLSTSTDAEIFRSIVWGTAFVERLAFELLAEVGYDTTGTVHFTGGGARNPWWNAIRAAVLGRPAVVPEMTEGAAGMAVLAAAAVGFGAEPSPLSAASSRLLGPPTPVQPAHIDPDAVQEAYAVFTESLHSRGWLDRRGEGSR